MPSSNDKTVLTREDCHSYVADQVFRLRPENYVKDYPKWPGMVGIELEMLPVRASTLKAAKPTLVPLYGDGDTLTNILAGLAKKRGWQPELTALGEGQAKTSILRVPMDHGDQLSFEPGGQFEFSSAPYPCLSEALLRLGDVQGFLASDLAAHDIALLQTGINPWLTVDEIGLQMPKPRYRAMDKYFTEIGPYGRRMMRQTCTVQVNLDFGPDERTLAQRFLAGQLLAPFATATFANSPFVDGKDSGLKSFRSRVWRGIDPSRTGIPPLKPIAAKLTKQACVDTYTESLLAAPVVFVEGAGYEVPKKKMTFAQWLAQPYNGVPARLSDFVTHTTLHFPEVRPRGFLEIRSVDCQSAVWQAVPAAFFAACLYDPQTLQEVIGYLEPLQARVNDLLWNATEGLKDREFAEYADKLMVLALAGFKRLPSCFQGDDTLRKFERYYEFFTSRGRTPADDYRELVTKTGQLLPVTLQQLDDQWRGLLK